MLIFFLCKLNFEKLDVLSFQIQLAMCSCVLCVHINRSGEFWRTSVSQQHTHKRTRGKESDSALSGCLVFIVIQSSDSSIYQREQTALNAIWQRVEVGVRIFLSCYARVPFNILIGNAAKDLHIQEGFRTGSFRFFLNPNELRTVAPLINVAKFSKEKVSKNFKANKRWEDFRGKNFARDPS